jgi:uncharacterized membrane protein YtjA (UPF0391 family)
MPGDPGDRTDFRWRPLVILGAKPRLKKWRFVFLGIALILAAIWLVGMLSHHTMHGAIHILGVLALLLITVSLVHRKPKVGYEPPQWN